MAQGVDGRALLHLTIEDMEKIGEMAGTVEGGGECALTLRRAPHRHPELHSRVRGDAQASPGDGEEPDAPHAPGPGPRKDEAELTTELCKTFGSTRIQGERWSSAPGRHGAQVQQAEGAEAAGGRRARLRHASGEEARRGRGRRLSTLGTFIQRPCCTT